MLSAGTRTCWLAAGLPEAVRLGRELEVGFDGGADGAERDAGEEEMLARLRALAARNRVARSYLGLGYHGTILPGVIRRNILENPGWYTQYTPYQAEISQGRLEALLNFQTMVADLTGMDVANASIYDGASSLAEAVLMSHAATGRSEVVLVGSVNPLYRRVVESYTQGMELRLRPVPAPDGVLEPDAVRPLVTEATAAVVVQSPNFYGCLEDVAALSEVAHAAGALSVVVAEPVNLGVLEAPGRLGADIVVGEGQGLGVPMSFGGPNLGVFAAKQALVRRMPGRLVGATVDLDGQRGFVLTLQARLGDDPQPPRLVGWQRGRRLHDPAESRDEVSRRCLRVSWREGRRGGSWRRGAGARARHRRRRRGAVLHRRRGADRVLDHRGARAARGDRRAARVRRRRTAPGRTPPRSGARTGGLRVREGGATGTACRPCGSRARGRHRRRDDRAGGARTESFRLTPFAGGPTRRRLRGPEGALRAALALLESATDSENRAEVWLDRSAERAKFILGREFDAVARSLLDHGSFGTQTLRPPGYPALMAGVYAIFGRDLLALRAGRLVGRGADARLPAIATDEVNRVVVHDAERPHAGCGEVEGGGRAETACPDQEDARLEQPELPFLADLVTLVDPTSRWSFLAYLRERGRLFRFYFTERFLVPRREYDAYLRWVAESLPRCRFSTRVEEVAWDAGEAAFRVTCREVTTARTTTVLARNVVLGVTLQGRVFKVPGHQTRVRSIWTHCAVAAAFAREVDRLAGRVKAHRFEVEQEGDDHSSPSRTRPFVFTDS